MMRLFYNCSQKQQLEERSGEFGRGFYFAFSLDAAKMWHRNLPCIREYEVNTEGLEMIDIEKEESSLEKWLAVILKNLEFDDKVFLFQHARKYLLDRYGIPDRYDILVGHRADNRYFEYAFAYLTNGLSRQKLEELLQYDELGRIAFIKRNDFERKLLNEYRVDMAGMDDLRNDGIVVEDKFYGRKLIIDFLRGEGEWEG